MKTLRFPTGNLVGFSMLLVVLQLPGLTGCRKESRPSEALVTGQASGLADLGSATESGSVYAQGQLLPAKGIIKLYASPGDVIVELPVEVGSLVKSGQVLAVMRSSAAIGFQREILIQQKLAAEREQAMSLRQAELKRSAAELKLQQVKTQESFCWKGSSC